MERIGVFCSASESISPLYFQRVKELGEWLGEQHMCVVFGGADMGLMACLAQAVKLCGGSTVGVVPDRLEQHGKVSPLLDQTIHTRNLSDRKDVILSESEVLVALPGGVGTLDEVFHVMAANTIGYHDKRVIFYNIDGFWDELLLLLSHLKESGFFRTPCDRLYAVANSLGELQQLLK